LAEAAHEPDHKSIGYYLISFAAKHSSFEFCCCRQNKCKERGEYCDTVAECCPYCSICLRPAGEYAKVCLCQWHAGTTHVVLSTT